MSIGIDLNSFEKKRKTRPLLPLREALDVPAGVLRAAGAEAATLEALLY
jgi:hypothetical protein